MSLDDLEHRLGQYEARLRETRRLLLLVKHRQAGLPEDLITAAARLFALSGEADSLAEELARMLQAESDKRTQALQARQQAALENDSTSRSNLPAAGWEIKTSTNTPDFGSRKLYGDDDDEAAGNAPVPAFPKRPVPVLVGGAARRFEESDEPPRNP